MAKPKTPKAEPQKEQDCEERYWYINTGTNNVFTAEGRCAPGERAQLTTCEAAKMPKMQRV